MSDSSAPRTILGIDLGTTAVKLAVVDAARGSVLACCEEPTHAYVTAAEGHKEQSPYRIVDALERGLDCLAAADDSALKSVSAVALSCQMHGVVCWRSSDMAKASPLYTWEDARCSDALLAEVNGAIWRDTRGRGLPVFSGYGAATLQHLARDGEGRSLLASFDRCGSIGAYIAALLTSEQQREEEEGARDSSDEKRKVAPACMDVTDASAWGCCSISSGRSPAAEPGAAGGLSPGASAQAAQWLPTFSAAMAPLELELPRIVHAPALVGHTPSASSGRPFRHSGGGSPLSPGLPVFAALGDHPAAMVAVAHWAAVSAAAPAPVGPAVLLVVTIGTSAQAALVPCSSAQAAAVDAAARAGPASTPLTALPLPPGCEERPFPAPGARPALSMLVGASLSGGNVIAAVCAALAPRVRELLLQQAGVEPVGSDDDAVYAYLEAEATAALDDAVDEGQAANSDGFDPTALLAPERRPAGGWPPGTTATGTIPESGNSVSGFASALEADEGNNGHLGTTPTGTATVLSRLQAIAAAADSRMLGRWYARTAAAVVRNTLERLPPLALATSPARASAAAQASSSPRTFDSSGCAGCAPPRLLAVVGAGGVLAKSACSRRLLERATAPLGAPVLWLPAGVSAYAGAAGAAIVAARWFTDSEGGGGGGSAP